MNTKEAIANISKVVAERNQFQKITSQDTNKKLAEFDTIINESVYQLKELLNLNKYFPYMTDADINQFYAYGNSLYEMALNSGGFDYVTFAVYLEREDNRIILGYDYRFTGDFGDLAENKDGEFSFTFEDLCDDIQMLEDAVKEIDKWRTEYKNQVLKKLG